MPKSEVRLTQPSAAFFQTPLLVVAASGRMLAAAARQAGFRPLVIDLFGDTDTLALADATVTVPSLDASSVAAAIAELDSRDSSLLAIYGSGLESHPETLEFLYQRCTLLGNTPEVFRRLHDKVDFFATLQGLDIPFPPVSFSAPAEMGTWLLKPVRNHGGIGIRRYRSGEAVEKDVYWQKYQSGISGSALFLANGHEFRLIGLNSQLTDDRHDDLEFAFSGLINHFVLSDGQKVQFCDWLARCVRAFAFRGLNSLDFIYEGERIFVLEINPRPSSSMQLYGNLLHHHIAACRGTLPACLPKPQGLNGMQIVYAKSTIRVPHGFIWPDWVADRPKDGTICQLMQPLCTVTASAETSEQLKSLLMERQQHIYNQLVKV